MSAIITESIAQINLPVPFFLAGERSESAAREARPLHAVVRPQSIISVQLRT